jgi:hypothetical protein
LCGHAFALVVFSTDQVANAQEKPAAFVGTHNFTQRFSKTRRFTRQPISETLCRVSRLGVTISGDLVDK